MPLGPSAASTSPAELVTIRSVVAVAVDVGRDRAAVGHRGVPERSDAKQAHAGSVVRVAIALVCNLAEGHFVEAVAVEVAEGRKADELAARLHLKANAAVLVEDDQRSLAGVDMPGA